MSLDACAFLLEAPESSLPPGTLALFLLLQLRPQQLLLGREILLVCRTHVLHKTLLTKNLLLLQLPESSLFLDLYKLDLFLKFLFTESLLDLCTFSHLLHLLGLLLESLPDQLRFKTLFLVLTAPSLLQDTVSMLLLTLPRIELRLHFPDSLLRLLFLKHFKQPLISFKLHICDALVL